MLLATTDTVAGREIAEVLGLVSGNAVRARHIGRDIMAGLKNIAGGEIGAYRDLLTESRDQAIGRMVDEATTLGADAIVGLRISTAEILAYGTAVRLA